MVRIRLGRRLSELGDLSLMAKAQMAAILATLAYGLLTIGLHASQASSIEKIEKGVVSAVGSGGFEMSAFPVLGRLASGRIVCLFSARSAAEKKMKIVAKVSDDGGRTWSQPVAVFDTPNAPDYDPNVVVDGDRLLAFSTTITGKERISESTILKSESRDGIRWTAPVRIATPHKYIAGKIHQGHRLSDGTLVIPYAWDTWAEKGLPPRTEGEMKMKAGVLRSTDGGVTWHPGADMYVDVEKQAPGDMSGLGEPAVVVLRDGRLMTLLRNASSTFYQAYSDDGGRTWSAPRRSALTGHNAPAALWLLDQSTEIVAVWSNSPDNRRTPLAAALSSDDGRSWSTPRVIEATDGKQVSYPSIVQTRDGIILAVWQQQLDHGREIRYARFSRDWLLGL